jgi:hypothetical protein
MPNNQNRGGSNSGKGSSERGGQSSGQNSSSRSGGNSNRGLASASKETRERVSREGGKASGGGRR